MRFKSALPAVILAAVLVLFGVSARAGIEIPDRPQNHVVDLAGVIDDRLEAGLNGYLLELEQKTTAQMVVLTINNLDGESLEAFSLSVAHDRWKLGQKGKDNGVLLLVAVNDRKYRFEIGYGLEGVLPDSLVGSIGREYLVPSFRKGDYSNGIFAGSLAIISTIASESGVEISGMPVLRTGRSPGEGKPTLLHGVFGILFFIVLAYMLIRHPRLLLLLLVMNTMGGGRGGWRGGGGFGGGGSFGGGGGGGFGGGGASGRW